MPVVPHTFCHACGTAYAELVWPRKCQQCGTEDYQNAVTVCVGIVPVTRDGVLIGVLAIRRDIEPRRGWLAFPGGFQDIESWQRGITREVFEETGIVIDPDLIQHYWTQTRPDGQQNLIFGVTQPVEEAQVLAFQPNSECSEIAILDKPQELAFPYHTQVLADFLTKMVEQGFRPAA